MTERPNDPIEALPADGGFYDIATLPGFVPAPGVQMNALTGARMMVNWVRLEPNGTVPDHSHPHEQIGFVLEGEIVMTIGDETRTVGPGNAYIVPGGVRHAGIGGPEGCLVVDVFSPVRDDYVEMAKGS